MAVFDELFALPGTCGSSGKASNFSLLSSCSKSAIVFEGDNVVPPRFVSMNKYTQFYNTINVD